MYDRDVTDEQVDKWLYKLNVDGKIIRYLADNKRLIQITKWWDYQTPSWASESKYPPPPNWIDRVKCHVAGGTIKNVNWDKDGGLSNVLHSVLPNQQDRPLNDIKDDVNDDIDDDDDFNAQDENTDIHKRFQRIYETKKGLPVTDGASFALMIGNFERAGVTADDYAAAIDAMDADDRYKGSKPTSYEKWALGIADKRKNPMKYAKDKKTRQDAEKMDAENYKRSWVMAK